MCGVRDPKNNLGLYIWPHSSRGSHLLLLFLVYTKSSSVWSNSYSRDHADIRLGRLNPVLTPVLSRGTVTEGGVVVVSLTLTRGQSLHSVRRTGGSRVGSGVPLVLCVLSVPETEPLECSLVLPLIRRSPMSLHTREYSSPSGRTHKGVPSPLLTTTVHGSVDIVEVEGETWGNVSGPLP